MRILIVSQYFWPESFRINELSVELVRRGHEVTVLTGLPNYPEGKIHSGYRWGHRRQEYEGVEVVRVPLVSRGNQRGPRLALNYLSYAASASLLGPLRCGRDYDAIFVFEVSPITVGIPAAVMSACSGAPILFWVQDLWPMTLEVTGAVRAPWLLKQVDRLTRSIYRRCKYVLGQSEAFAPILKQQGVTDEQFAYIPNWVDDRFAPRPRHACQAEDQDLPKGFRILFAGNLGSSQSLGTVLDAAAITRHSHPSIQWVLMGDGNARNQLLQDVAERQLGSVVSLPGSRPLDRMPGYFGAADGLLVTLARNPIFAATIPSKLQAYLACGRPILAGIDGEGARIVREAGAGYAAPAEDPVALAKAAIELFETSGQQREAMGRRSRAYFLEHFQQSMVIDRIEELLYRATGEIPPIKSQTTQERIACAA